MGFILDGLETESYDREYRDRELLRRIVRFFRPHLRKMVLVAAVLALNSAAGSGAPIAISRAIDAVATDPSLRTMLIACIVVLLLGALAWTANFVQQWVSARVVGEFP